MSCFGAIAHLHLQLFAFVLGLLDGREGLLLHLYHSVYVSWKYAKAWELERKALMQGQRRKVC